MFQVNNNIGIVTDAKDAQEDQIIKLGQAFSFYTWIKSRRRILIVDIQGWIQSDGDRLVLLLTDPAVVSKTGGIYGVTDLGEESMLEFRNSYAVHYKQNE